MLEAWSQCSNIVERESLKNKTYCKVIMSLWMLPLEKRDVGLTEEVLLGRGESS